MSHYFDKLWGKRRELPPPRRQADRQTAQNASTPHRQQNAIIDQTERRKREYARYIEARKARLDTLARDYPAVATYRRTLKSLLNDKECRWTGPRDCNVDLADLVRRMRLSELPRDYDRFLVLEVTNSFISALGKRQHVNADEIVSDSDPLPLGGREETEVDLVAKELMLR